MTQVKRHATRNHIGAQNREFGGSGGANRTPYIQLMRLARYQFSTAATKKRPRPEPEPNQRPKWGGALGRSSYNGLCRRALATDVGPVNIRRQFLTADQAAGLAFDGYRGTWPYVRSNAKPFAQISNSGTTALSKLRLLRR